jgi:hypothetical protein
MNPVQIKEDEMGGHIARMESMRNGNNFSRETRNLQHAWEMKNVYKILVGKPEGKKPIGRPRHKW